MKIHEYQSKQLFNQYNITVEKYELIEDESQIEEAIVSLEKQEVNQFVVKAQIHAGGRGKGGGVKVARSREEAIQYTKEILGMTLVTPQTTDKGQLVRKVVIAETSDIKKELYASITLDRSQGKDIFMVSTEGGMDIEEVAAKTPEKIVKIYIDPALGLMLFQARELCFALGLNKDKGLMKQGLSLFTNLYRCYSETDASIMEINPLVITQSLDLFALDAKINFDDNALFRQKNILEMRDVNEEDPAEVEASKYNLNFIKLEGNVGCMVNGAGLAMATMDIIKLKGGQPANFLDVGGTASAETVKQAFRIILEDVSVNAILINIFGGIVRCDRVANGIVEAVKELSLSIPVVVRLQGTNADLAKEILQNSNVEIIAASELSEAAEKAVKLTT